MGLHRAKVKTIKAVELDNVHNLKIVQNTDNSLIFSDHILPYCQKNRKFIEKAGKRYDMHIKIHKRKINKIIQRTQNFTI